MGRPIIGLGPLDWTGTSEGVSDEFGELTTTAMRPHVNLLWTLVSSAVDWAAASARVSDEFGELTTTAMRPHVNLLWTLVSSAVVWAAASARVSDEFDAGASPSKRGFNDVVDLCIAYNCPSAVPGSLEFMKCVSRYHCM